MSRARFPLSSDQLELLLAFQDSAGLTDLADRMAKDASVISRNLQRAAEAAPVLKKIKGRWELTPLGLQINALTKEFLARQDELLSAAAPVKPQALTEDSLLIVINAQCGLLDATQGGRNNSEAEKNIAALLSHWRARKMPVLHVKHVSDKADSVFHRRNPGCGFLPQAFPAPGEGVVEKTKSSAFTETALEAKLREIEPRHLVLAGFTANECIDATARDAAALGFSVHVVGDATAMFDLRGADGKLLKAERLHRLTLANLNAFYAKVIQTRDVTG